MERNRPTGICIERGETLPKSLEIASKPLASDFLDVSGFGELAWMEITNESEEGRPSRFEGPLQLLTLRGRIRRAGPMTISDFVCMVSRQTDNGISVIGGKLIRAGINHLEVTFTPLDPPDAAPQPSPKPKEPVSAPKYVEPPTQEQATPSPKKREPAAAPMDERWAKAVAETRRYEMDDDDLDENADLRPAHGDKVIHKQFGECVVARIDDDHITLRKPDGRHVQLGLQILAFKRVGHRDGKDLFDVEVSTRR